MYGNDVGFPKAVGTTKICPLERTDLVSSKKIDRSNCDELFFEKVMHTPVQRIGQAVEVPVDRIPRVIVTPKTMRPSLLRLIHRIGYSSFTLTAALQPIRTMTTSTPEKPRIAALFDVDGTLTIPRGEITPDMMAFMKELSKKITVGIVGGSDLPKQEEQLGEGIVNLFPYNFSQNGLVAYKNGELLEVQTIAKFLGEDNIKRIVNWTLKYLSELDLPVKVRG